MLRMKRAYDPPSGSDGTRVLVERLWPRGVSKERAAIDHWCKEIAPSAELRKWYSHDASKWEEFRRRYLEELKGNSAVGRLEKLAEKGTVTMVFAARDPERSSAKVLTDLLRGSAEQAVL
jgi:uncharacterized protein YeaO (DUF488 family)